MSKIRQTGKTGVPILSVSSPISSYPISISGSISSSPISISEVFLCSTGVMSFLLRIYADHALFTPCNELKQILAVPLTPFKFVLRIFREVMKLFILFSTIILRGLQIMKFENGKK